MTGIKLRGTSPVTPRSSRQSHRALKYEFAVLFCAGMTLGISYIFLKTTSIPVYEPTETVLLDNFETVTVQNTFTIDENGRAFDVVIDLTTGKCLFLYF